MLGAVLAVSSAGWLVVAHLRASTDRGVILAVVGTVGLVLAGTGLARAARAPVDPDVETLRAIASAVEDQVLRLNKKDGFEDDRFFPLSTRRGLNYTGRKISLSRPPLPRVRNQLVGLIGESGAGKTLSLRHMTLQVCQDVRRKRHPDLIALYIDLAAFSHSSDTIIADDIYSYIQDAIATGNTTLSSHFTRYVREPRDRPTWTIFFDSFDVLLQSVNPDRRDEAARQYLDTIRQFLSSTGPNFQGIVACRNPRWVESLGGSVLTLVPLSRYQIAAFSQRAGLDAILKHQLLQNLRRNPGLEQTVRNPMLLGFLCDRLRQTRGSEFPSTLDEIVSTAVAMRLESGQNSSVIDERLRAAEQIAYYLISEVGLNRTPNYDDAITSLRLYDGVPHPAATVQDLVEVGIVRYDGPQIFTFSHSCYQEHFTVSWLLRSWKNYDLRRVALEPQWRSAAITALQSGEAELGSALVTIFAEALADEVEVDPGVVKTVAPLTAIDPTEPLPPMPSVSFTWPRTALRILQIITTGLRHEPKMLPSQMRSNVDRLVVSAFAAGLLLDQQQAIEVSAMSTAKVALWAAKRALASPSRWLQRAATRQLVVAPHLFALLEPETRIISISIAVSDPVVFDQAFDKSNETATLSGTLAGVLRDLVRVGKVTAWVLAIYSLKGLIIDFTSIPEWHRHGLPAGVVFWPLLITIATLYLGCWTGRRRGPEFLSSSVAAALIFIAVIAAIGGIIELIAAVILTVTHASPSAISDGIAAYALTWPISMVARILEAPSPMPRDWAFPQFPAAKMGIAQLSFRCREYLQRKRGASKRRFGNVPPELILERLDGARTTAETEQVLRNIAAGPLGPKAASVNELRDLARALEWVNRMVPAGTTTSIPPGVWDLGPDFSSPKFGDWLRRFDKRHPGRLSWLARSHREEIAQALDRADSQNQ